MRLYSIVNLHKKYIFEVYDSKIGKEVDAKITKLISDEVHKATRHRNEVSTLILWRTYAVKIDDTWP